MVELVGRAFKKAGIPKPVVIVGHHGEQVEEALGDAYYYAWQREQLGTGHAALMAEQALAGFEGPVLVAAGDAPLLDPDYLRSLIETQRRTGATCVMATCVMDNPFGYGRVIYDEHGAPCNIVEEKDADEETKKLKEVCVSLYCFDGKHLFRLLKTLNTNNAQGEYYLTDMIKAVYNDGGRTVTVPTTDVDMLQGVNDRWQLAQAASVLRRRINRAHAMAGVTIIDPVTTYIGLDVEIGVDTVIHPMCTISGKTKIGERCEIGPSSNIQESTIEDGCTVLMSQVNGATMKSGSRIGPFSNLRPGTVLGEDAKVGNFVEIKNSDIGQRVSLSHLTYIGDASIGSDTNIGAGTITCNYDGFVKNRTTIGANAFVGSNSTLVAPVRIGDDALIAAGSVITSDVPDWALGIGRGKQENKEDWVRIWRARKQKK